MLIPIRLYTLTTLTLILVTFAAIGPWASYVNRNARHGYPRQTLSWYSKSTRQSLGCDPGNNYPKHSGELHHRDHGTIQSPDKLTYNREICDETSTNLIIPGARIFHALGARVLKVVATCLSTGYYTPPPAIQALAGRVRMCAEMAVIDKHILERLYPPSSKGGENNNKYLIGLGHDIFWSAECQELIDSDL